MGRRGADNRRAPTTTTEMILVDDDEWLRSRDFTKSRAPPILFARVSLSLDLSQMDDGGNPVLRDTSRFISDGYMPPRIKEFRQVSSNCSTTADIENEQIIVEPPKLRF